MITLPQGIVVTKKIYTTFAVLGVLAAAFYLGRRPSPVYLLAPIGAAALLVLLRFPRLGLLATITVALLIPVAIGTGTEVSLNLSALAVPGVFLIWLLTRLQAGRLDFTPSRTNRPLILFLLLALLSIFIGNAIWDPAVPRSDKFIIVQLAQWALFAFSAAIYWLVGNLVKEQVWLKRLAALFLLIAGGLAMLRTLPGGVEAVNTVGTFAIYRAPFWLLLAGLAAGQLLYNKSLSWPWRIFLIAALGAVLMYAFGDQQERTSNWLGIAIVLSVLIWLRFPRIRWPVMIVIGALLMTGVLFQFIYDYAGGDEKWTESGASRGVLIERVIELSMRNPITGIGPAAYRPYGFTRPLYYEGALWIEPRINSHNNYVDLFSQTGILGLAIFLWFMAELGWLGWRLRKVYTSGFTGGYVASMLAVWAGIMVIMALADWFLPFVYNIGFPGFQASVLVWLFFGGLLSLDRMRAAQAGA